MTTIIDKDLLRKSLKDFTTYDPDFVSELMFEINEELKKLKRKKLENIVNEDFEEYGEVFKALA